MAQVFFCILLLLISSVTSCKYIYIDQPKTRSQALSYCQKKYTDLAPVSNKQDHLKLMKLYPSGHNYVLFGLQKNRSVNKWMWSGGGEVTCSFWDNGQPNNQSNAYFGYVKNNSRWHNAYGNYRTTFFCYRAVVVQEKKTWEEALEYCRKHYDDLASIASTTEMLLIQRQLKKHSIKRNVWIGLRFLAGDWLWVDGQKMDYKAWGPRGKPSCPDVKMKCAGLQVAGGNQGVWMPRDCEEKLNFICY